MRRRSVVLAIQLVAFALLGATTPASGAEPAYSSCMQLLDWDDPESPPAADVDLRAMFIGVDAEGVVLQLSLQALPSPDRPRHALNDPGRYEYIVTWYDGNRGYDVLIRNDESGWRFYLSRGSLYWTSGPSPWIPMPAFGTPASPNYVLLGELPGFGSSLIPLEGRVDSAAGTVAVRLQHSTLAGAGRIWSSFEAITSTGGLRGGSSDTGEFAAAEGWRTASFDTRGGCPL